MAKGILIISVLINHIGNLAAASGVENNVINIIPSLRFWCPFFMPAFFVITGLCSDFNKPIKVFIIKNFKMLIIPAFTLLFVRVLLRIILDGEFSHLEFSTFHDGNFLLNVGYWNWFLVAMFTTKLFYWALYRYISNLHIQLLICLFLHAIGFCIIHLNNGSRLFYNVWFYQHALLFVIYLFVGNQIISKYRMLYQKTGWILANAAIFTIIYSLFAVEGWRIPKITSDIFLTSYDLAPHLIMSLTGTFAVIGICFKLNNNEYLEKVGRNSLVIYCLHFPVFFAFYKIFRLSLNNMGIHDTITSLIILHIFTLNLTMCVCKILNLRYLRILLGKF